MGCGSTKYYCDYNIVANLGQETIDNSNTMKEKTENYDQDMNNTLFGDQDMYEGRARDAFDNRLHDENGLVNGANDIANFGSELGSHVIEATEKIKELDEKLAQLKI